MTWFCLAWQLTMKELGVDLYPLVVEKYRPRAVPVQFGVNTPCYLADKRVAVSVWSLQSGGNKYTGVQEEETPACGAVQHMRVPP